MAETFTSILDRQSSEIERPKPLPVGTYLCIVKGLPRYDKSSKKQTDFVEFNLEIQSAEEDVDADAIEAFKGGVVGKSVKDTYYLTEEAAFRVKDFLEHCGVEDEGTLRSRIEQTPGCQLKVFIKHEPSQDGQTMFARIGKTMAAD